MGLKRKKNNIFDCSTLLHKDIADVIIPFHIHTRADALSGFYGHGKPSVFESAMKSQKALKLLSGLGKSLPVTSQTEKDMEKFTIKYVYKDKTRKTLAEARTKKWDAMKRKSTLRIPPDTDSHHLKVTRGNYQTFIMLSFMDRDTSLSTLQHGWNLQMGKCLPIRHTKPALPQRLVNMQVNDTVADTDSESESGSDSDSASDGYDTEYE